MGLASLSAIESQLAVVMHWCFAAKGAWVQLMAEAFPEMSLHVSHIVKNDVRLFGNSDLVMNWWPIEGVGPAPCDPAQKQEVTESKQNSWKIRFNFEQQIKPVEESHHCTQSSPGSLRSENNGGVYFVTVKLFSGFILLPNTF